MAKKPTAEEVRSLSLILQLEQKNTKLKNELLSYQKRLKVALSELEQAEQRSAFVDAIGGTSQRIHRWDEEKKKTGVQATAFAVLSDWHLEEDVSPATVNYLNEFNPKIAEQRVKRIAWKIIEYLERYCPMARVLYLMILGDLITGYIHEELLETNHMTPPEAARYAKDLVCAVIDFILRKKPARLKKIICVTTHGNHSRTSPKERIKSSAKNSYEWMMYEDLKDLYRREPRVVWQTCEGDHNYVEVYGRLVRCHHGTGIRYNGGIGGFTISANKKKANWDKSPFKAELDIFGHLHTMGILGNMVANSSLIGHSAYGIRLGCQYEPPTQMFVVFSKNRGFHFSVPMFCNETDPTTEEVMGKILSDHKQVKKIAF